MNIYNYFTKDFLNNYSFVRYYSRNAVIALEGSECQYIGFIDEGNITISTISYQNKEEIINILGENQFFGNNLLFATTKIYLGSIITKSCCRIRFFNKENFLKLLENKEFLADYLKFISDESIKIKNQAKLLAHKNIKDRIMYYLREECRNENKNYVEIKSMTLFSSILSLPRPSVSREIKNMCSEGLIEYKNKKIFLIK